MFVAMQVLELLAVVNTNNRWRCFFPCILFCADSDYNKAVRLFVYA